MSLRHLYRDIDSLKVYGDLSDKIVTHDDVIHGVVFIRTYSIHGKPREHGLLRLRSFITSRGMNDFMFTFEKMIVYMYIGDGMVKISVTGYEHHVGKDINMRIGSLDDAVQLAIKIYYMSIK